LAASLHMPSRPPVSSIRARCALSFSHSHNLVTAIDVYDLACDCCCAIAGEKNSGGAELGWIATALQRRAILIMFQHRGETADPARSQRLDSTGRYAIHTNFFRSKIVGQITGAGFEACLGHSHHIVVWH